jgi:hypothetical protein
MAEQANELRAVRREMRNDTLHNGLQLSSRADGDRIRILLEWRSILAVKAR